MWPHTVLDRLELMIVVITMGPFEFHVAELGTIGYYRET